MACKSVWQTPESTCGQYCKSDLRVATRLCNQILTLDSHKRLAGLELLRLDDWDLLNRDRSALENGERKYEPRPKEKADCGDATLD